jgi:hypothetical protein
MPPFHVVKIFLGDAWQVAGDMLSSSSLLLLGVSQNARAYSRSAAWAGRFGFTHLSVSRYLFLLIGLGSFGGNDHKSNLEIGLRCRHHQSAVGGWERHMSLPPAPLAPLTLSLSLPPSLFPSSLAPKGMFLNHSTGLKLFQDPPLCSRPWADV